MSDRGNCLLVMKVEAPSPQEILSLQDLIYILAHNWVGITIVQNVAISIVNIPVPTFFFGDRNSLLTEKIHACCPRYRLLTDKIQLVMPLKISAFCIFFNR